MSSGGGPPRKPPGPPPAVPPSGNLHLNGGDSIRGIGAAENGNGGVSKKVPGPPTGMPPTSFKPPPMAPPPRSLIAAERPSVDSIKAIDPTKIGNNGAHAGQAPPPRGLPGGAQSSITPMGPPPRGPPPRALPGDFRPTEYKGDANIVISNGNGKNGHVNGGAATTAGEKSTPVRSQASRKAGAIEMFDSPAGSAGQEPADKKTRVEGAAASSMKGFSPGTLGGPRPGPPARAENPNADPTVGFVGKASRPAPPLAQPPGIPIGQPLPPDAALIPKEGRAPPPMRQVPDRGRAPPRDDPAVSKKVESYAPPDVSEVPFKKGKKEVVVEEVYVPRRERENPEFESSSSDEDGNKKVRAPIAKPKPGARVAAAAAVAVPTSAAAAKAEEAKPSASATASVKQTSPSKSEAAAGASASSKVDPEASLKTDAAPSIKAEVQSVVEEIDAAFPSSQGRDGGQEVAAAAAEEEEDEEAPPMKIPPSMGVALSASGFVPPPPSEYEPEFDHSRLGKELQKGRLVIKCISGTNIRRKDEVNKVPKQDPFLKFKLGAAERHPWKSTTVRRKQDGEPDFENEIVFFDIVDPQDFVFQGDLQIRIECWNKGTFKEEPMGGVTLSVVRFMKAPFISYTERLPIFYQGSTTSQSKLVLEIVFEQARPGIFELTLYEARNVRNVDPMGRQHPYIKLKLGRNYSKRSKTIKDGGTSPYFGEEKMLVWADRESWVDDLQVLLLDEDMGEDKPIGETHFSFLAYMNTRPDQAKEDVFDLFYYQKDPKDDRIRKEFAQGQLVMCVRFFPAGTLTATFDRAARLKFPESYEPLPGQGSRMDPYINITADSQAVQIIKRTPADKDGGADPVWKYEMVYDIVDQYMLQLEVFHQSIQGADVLIGAVPISLLTVFRSGKHEFWVTLKQKKANGGIKESGEVFVILEFQAPAGIVYPQLRPDVLGFDDTVRQLPPDKKPDDAEEAVVVLRKPVETVPVEGAPKIDLAPKKNDFGEEIITQEFSDAEIIAAFNFIDLDHNNFVGAREIRHILVCMGEMITDEEIDCMISMVDMDGDGQVSLQEFRTLVLHPDPGMVDMHKEVNLAKDKELELERQMKQGKVQGKELTAYQRQRELTLREAKKKGILTFVQENEITFDSIKNFYQIYVELPKERRPGGRVKFGDFCICLGVEPITEYRMLHALFDSEDVGDADLREFLLGCMNFIEVDREARIRTTFLMFDELKSGYISQKEVEEILRGNHMLGLASVQRKAETVMKQASANSVGAITMNEFVVVCKKFPNVATPLINDAKTKGKKK